MKIYVAGKISGLEKKDIDEKFERAKADLIGKLQRWDAERDPEGFQAIQQRLVELENQRRFLRPID